jgi:hypothetical protein
VRARNAARDAGLLLVVGQAFAGEELGAAVRKLDDNRRVEVAGGFEHGIHGVGAGHVHGGQGVAVSLGVLEEGLHFVAVQNAGAQAGESGCCHEKETLKAAKFGLFWVKPSTGALPPRSSLKKRKSE